MSKWLIAQPTTYTEYVREWFTLFKDIEGSGSVTSDHLRKMSNLIDPDNIEGTVVAIQQLGNQFKSDVAKDAIKRAIQLTAEADIERRPYTSTIEKWIHLRSKYPVVDEHFPYETFVSFIEKNLDLVYLLLDDDKFAEFIGNLVRTTDEGKQLYRKIQEKFIEDLKEMREEKEIDVEKVSRIIESIANFVGKVGAPILIPLKNLLGLPKEVQTVPRGAEEVSKLEEFVPLIHGLSVIDPNLYRQIMKDIKFTEVSSYINSYLSTLESCTEILSGIVGGSIDPSEIVKVDADVRSVKDELSRLKNEYPELRRFISVDNVINKLDKAIAEKKPDIKLGVLSDAIKQLSAIKFRKGAQLSSVDRSILNLIKRSVAVRATLTAFDYALDYVFVQDLKTGKTRPLSKSEKSTIKSVYRKYRKPIYEMASNIAKFIDVSISILDIGTRGGTVRKGVLVGRAADRVQRVEFFLDDAKDFGNALKAVADALGEAIVEKYPEAKFRIIKKIAENISNLPEFKDLKIVITPTPTEPRRPTFEELKEQYEEVTEYERSQLPRYLYSHFYMPFVKIVKDLRDILDELDKLVTTRKFVGNAIDLLDKLKEHAEGAMSELKQKARIFTAPANEEEKEYAEKVSSWLKTRLNLSKKQKNNTRAVIIKKRPIL